MPINASKPRARKLDPRRWMPANPRADFDQRDYDSAWLYRMAQAWMMYWRVIYALAFLGVLASLYLAFLNIWALLLVAGTSHGFTLARQRFRRARIDLVDAELLLELCRSDLEDEFEN